MRVPRVRFTVRWMMAFVGLVAVVLVVLQFLAPHAERVSFHWYRCREEADTYRARAAHCAQIPIRLPDGTLKVANSIRLPDGTVKVPTNKDRSLALWHPSFPEMSRYCAAVARMYERAKWRPWEGIPEPPPPPPPKL
jgi:hypothetical protein